MTEWGEMTFLHDNQMLPKLHRDDVFDNIDDSRDMQRFIAASDAEGNDKTGVGWVND